MKKVILLFILINIIKISAQTQEGTLFYLTFLPSWVNNDTVNSSKLKLYITSKTETLVRVSIESKNYYDEKITKPNDIIEFTLDPEIGQPYIKMPMDLPNNDSVYTKSAVIIQSESPITVYAVTRYWHTTDGYLALPFELLGKEYIISSYSTLISGNILPSEVSIVASEDNTTVSIKIGGNPVTTTMSGLKPNDIETKILNKGDVWLISGNDKGSDLSGSKITSDKPIAVVSGHYCSYVPTNKSACDCLNEMEISTDKWENEIIVPNIAKRLKGSILKIFAKESDTKVYLNNSFIGTLESGGIEGEGFFHIRSSMSENVPVMVSGDKPIHVTLFNPGQSDDGIASDPFQMNLLPVSSYVDEILFTTPGIKDGAYFNENYIALVFEADSPQIPDDFLFAKSVNGSLNWQKMNDIYNNSQIRFAGNIDGKNYYVKTILLSEINTYSIKSSSSNFMAYAYGFSDWESYGFPTSVAKMCLSDSTKIYLKMNETTANPGEIIEIPIFYNTFSNLAEQGINYISFDLSYNPTLLYPLDYTSEIISDNLHKIKIENIPFPTSGEILTNIRFKVGLGNSKYSDIAIFDAKTQGCSSEIFIENSKFTLLGICEEGGSRLINPSLRAGFNSIYPQPANNSLGINYSLIEKGKTEIYLQNIMGKNVKTLFEENIENIGIRQIEFNVSDLGAGLYFVVLKTPSHTFYKKVLIVK